MGLEYEAKLFPVSANGTVFDVVIFINCIKINLYIDFKGDSL